MERGISDDNISSRIVEGEVGQQIVPETSIKIQVDLNHLNDGNVALFKEEEELPKDVSPDEPQPGTSRGFIESKSNSKPIITTTGRKQVFLLVSLQNKRYTSMSLQVTYIFTYIS